LTIRTLLVVAALEGVLCGEVRLEQRVLSGQQGQAGAVRAGY
jgi:hypothetical protein